MNNIYILSREFPPDLGGAGSYAYDVARGLSKQEQNVIVITTNTINKDRLNNSNFDIYEVEELGKLTLLNMYKSFKSFDIQNKDKIILNDRTAQQIGALLFNSKLKKQSICILHGSEPESIYKFPSILYKLIKYDFFYNKLLEKSNAIIAVSNDMKNKFIEISGLDYLRSKISVVKNSVNLKQFFPEMLNFKEEHNIISKNKIIFSASRLTKKKGYDIMFDNFKKLKEINHGVIWIIAGDGDYFESFKNKVQESNYSNYVIFLGNVHKDSLRKYYTTADVFFLLSKHRESFGLVYLEANACGTPVVGFDYGGISEAIINKETGVLIKKSESKKAYMILNKILKGEISFNKNNLVRHAENNNLDHMIKSLKKEL